MIPLHEDVFWQFRHAAQALRIYPKGHTLVRADDIYADKFKKWQDIIGITEISVSPTESGDFDRVWIFNLSSRPTNNRHKSASFPLTFLAHSSTTRKIGVLTTTSSAKHLERIFEGKSELQQALASYSGIKTNKSTPASKDIPPHLYSHHDGIEWLDHALDRYAAIASLDITKLTEQGNNTLALPGHIREHLRQLARDAAALSMTTRVKAALADFYGLIDAEIYQAAADFCADQNDAKMRSKIQIYNHIISASHERAYGTRIGALPIIARSGDLFLDQKEMWAAIDSGTSLFSAMGSALGVSGGTVRHMLRKPYLDCFKRGLFQEQAYWLDAINIQNWPQDHADFEYFQIVCRLAKHYAQTFHLDPQKALREWCKVEGPHCNWKSIATKKLAKQFRVLIADKRNLFQQLFLSSHRQVPSQIDPLSDPRLDNNALMENPLFWSLAIQKYENDLQNINDMKQDVGHRILRAALHKTIGYLHPDRTRQLNAATVDALTVQLQQQLWKNCPPFEQTEASNYWHSPRVNFNNRFSALTTTFGMSWHTILEKPLQIDSITIVALGSDDALREEAGAMDHCVWSYGPYCLKGGHHIFSLRNDKGERLSTLDLVEEWHPDGKVTFSIRQNLSIHDSPAPQAARNAAKKFVATLNLHTILQVDWAAIKADRAAFAAKPIDSTVGYDFRDDEIAQKVFDLYEPCLPRKIARTSGGTLDGFARALGIPELVAAQVKPATLPQPPRPTAP